MKVNPVITPELRTNYRTIKLAKVNVGIQTGRDEVTFSKEALNHLKIIAEVESRTQEERARIAEITTAVRKGEYRIDSDKIAERILMSDKRGL